MKICFTIMAFFSFFIAFAQEGEVVKGNRYYKDGKYDKAEEAYQKALSKKESPVTRYNLGNAQYKKDNIDQAVKSFDDAATATDDPELKTKALYNKGVLLHKNNRLTEAIEAYKQALRLSPNDEEVRKNLQLALRARKQQQPEEKKKELQKEISLTNKLLNETKKNKELTLDEVLKLKSKIVYTLNFYQKPRPLHAKQIPFK